MNRNNLQELAEIRLRESRVLLGSGCAEGLAGYAVECALKACIARRTREHDFPDQKLANASYTHKLGDLLQLAQLQDALQGDPVIKNNWDIVRTWSELSRYQRKTLSEAAELLAAIENPTGGILPWVRKRW